MNITQFWGQVFTQAVCFILFFLILRWLAWKPVLQFLEERRARIRSDMDRAKDLEQQAKETQASLDERLEKIEDEARERVQEAVAEGRRAAEEVTDNARKDGIRIREHAKEMAQIEFAKAMQEVKDDVIRMTLTATERLLREEMDEPRQRRMVTQFLDDLERD